MSKKEEKKGVNPELEKFLNDLMRKAKSDPDMSLTDKMRIADRVLKLEQLKQKFVDDEFGSGFHDD